jgi:hypothetical protein
MCRMTGARPVRVSGIAARLAGDIAPGQANYGQLQVTFDDGSIGWYEAGWGPMMSETAFFVKDVIGRAAASASSPRRPRAPGNRQRSTRTRVQKPCACIARISVRINDLRRRRNHPRG